LVTSPKDAPSQGEGATPRGGQDLDRSSPQPNVAARHAADHQAEVVAGRFVDALSISRLIATPLQRPVAHTLEAP
jgi:hypothetical protein